MGKILTVADRKAKFVVEQDGCWLWTGSITRHGYGQLTSMKKTWLSHRYFYTEIVGPIPDGLTLDHLCRNRACVNPRHLEPVTNQENVLRGEVSALRKDQTHCKNGHEYTEANTYWSTSRGTKARSCRECRYNRSSVANKTEHAKNYQKQWHLKKVQEPGYRQAKREYALAYYYGNKDSAAHD